MANVMMDGRGQDIRWNQKRNVQKYTYICKTTREIHTHSPPTSQHIQAHEKRCGPQPVVMAQKNNGKQKRTQTVSPLAKIHIQFSRIRRKQHSTWGPNENAAEGSPK